MSDKMNEQRILAGIASPLFERSGERQKGRDAIAKYNDWLNHALKNLDEYRNPQATQKILKRLKKLNEDLEVTGGF